MKLFKKMSNKVKEGLMVASAYINYLFVQGTVYASGDAVASAINAKASGIYSLLFGGFQVAGGVFIVLGAWKILTTFLGDGGDASEQKNGIKYLVGGVIGLVLGPVLQAAGLISY